MRRVVILVPDAMNMNAKYTTIPTTPHLNHNLADLSRSSIRCLMEFPKGNKTIALTPNIKFNPYIFCSRVTKLAITKMLDSMPCGLSRVSCHVMSKYNQSLPFITPNAKPAASPPVRGMPRFP
jgi:hypothetical protein